MDNEDGDDSQNLSTSSDRSNDLKFQLKNLENEIMRKIIKHFEENREKDENLNEIFYSPVGERDGKFYNFACFMSISFSTCFSFSCISSIEENFLMKFSVRCCLGSPPEIDAPRAHSSDTELHNVSL